MISSTLVSGAEPVAEAWVYGKWELVYDPDGAAQDWLEFFPNGDVTNLGKQNKKIEGIYVVSADQVTAVFSQSGKDVITVFFFDEDHRALRIITSRSGKESIYKKIKQK
jgi:hypothetical protein